MIVHGDCVEVMAGMEPESVDAIVTDPPYGLEFMGKAWDRLGDTGTLSHRGPDASELGSKFGNGVSYSASGNMKCGACHKWKWSSDRCRCDKPEWPNMAARQGVAMQEWHARWAEAAYRVAKPSSYLLAFGGTRTVHRMTVALEDAGWIIRDMLVWAYASGFPKSKASLKPAWEPIVMARKPGPLRMLAIDECRIPAEPYSYPNGPKGNIDPTSYNYGRIETPVDSHPAGRWPANIVLTDPIFDGDVDGVVGGGEASYNPGGVFGKQRVDQSTDTPAAFPVRKDGDGIFGYGDSGTYSRFFLIPKAARSDREPVLGGLPTRVVNITEGHGLGPVNTSKGGDGIRENRPRSNVHPTVKPTDLMRHLVRLVTPAGGVVLDPFLGSGTTALAAEMEGFEWIGIEREAEYVAIAEARLNGTQRGLGLEAL